MGSSSSCVVVNTRRSSMCERRRRDRMAEENDFWWPEGEVLRSPQPRVASRYGAACRMCHGQRGRRARGPTGSGIRSAGGAGNTDAQHPSAAPRLPGHVHWQRDQSDRAASTNRARGSFARSTPTSDAEDGGAHTAERRDSHYGYCRSSVWMPRARAPQKSSRNFQENEEFLFYRCSFLFNWEDHLIVGLNYSLNNL